MQSMVVALGVKMDEIYGSAHAWQYMAANNVHGDIIWRVLSEPSGRRPDDTAKGGPIPASMRDFLVRVVAAQSELNVQDPPARRGTESVGAAPGAAYIH